MIKNLKIKKHFFLAFFYFILFESCNNRSEIEKKLTNNDFRYWRLYENGIGSNIIIRFDNDGSAYELTLNHGALEWDIRNNSFSDLTKFQNNWILKKDSIYWDWNYYQIKLYNPNSDSTYISLNRFFKNYFENEFGKVTDSIVKINFILRPYKHQIDFFDFDSIKNKKGTDLYYDKKQREELKKNWK